MSLIELNNFREHPENKSYMVFIYSDYEMALCFEDQLTEAGLEFEKDISESGPNKRYLYGIRKRDFSAAKEMNHVALGLHRKPFMPDPVLRIFVLALTAGLITLAIIGYLRS